MKHCLTLFFKLPTITDFMDKMDLSDGSRKIFCNIIDITIETKGDWCLSPAVAEALEEAFNQENILPNPVKEENILVGIYDSANDVFYNFTDKKHKITMFSNGSNFVYFNTSVDIKTERYIKAYNRFIFNNKQAKNDKYVYNISGWLYSKKELSNEDSE